MRSRSRTLVPTTSPLGTLPKSCRCPSRLTPEQQKDLDASGLTDVALAGLERSGLAFKLRLEIYEDPFVVGIMHDIGKVALVHSYPGLYKAVVEEMARQGWAIPMHTAEETIAGGADHTVVGEILADTWQMAETIGHIVGEHHQPTEGDSLVELVALTDMMANAIFPLPADAAFPLARMAGTLTAAPASNDSAKDNPVTRPLRRNHPGQYRRAGALVARGNARAVRDHRRRPRGIDTSACTCRSPACRQHVGGQG